MCFQRVSQKRAKNLPAPQHLITLPRTLRLRFCRRLPTPSITSRRFPHEQGFAYYTPPPAHSRHAARFLKPLPIALLAAVLAAPAAWADDCFSYTFGSETWCINDYNGSGSDNNFTVDTSHSASFVAAGGYSDPITPAIDVKNNILTIASSGRVERAYGGYSESDSGSVEDNTLIIKGKVTGNAYGGYAEEVSATKNTVILESGSVDGDMYGSKCRAPSCNDVTGNTLKVQDKSSKVGGKVANFEKLVFTLPAGLTASDIMLDITGVAASGNTRF